MRIAILLSPRRRGVAGLRLNRVGEEAAGPADHLAFLPVVRVVLAVEQPLEVLGHLLTVRLDPREQLDSATMVLTSAMSSHAEQEALRRLSRNATLARMDRNGELIPRRAGDELRAQMRTFRAVVVRGPRQAGKTTLLRDLALTDATFLTLDDDITRQRVADDPTAVASLPAPLVIDEYQRGGTELLLALKARLDRDRARGQVVLAGSTNLLADGLLGDTLTGRVGFVDLLPLSVGEVVGRDERFLDLLAAGADALRAAAPATPLATGDLITRGGFPELVTTSSLRAGRWFDAYLATVVEHEAMQVRDVAAPEDLTRLLRAVALTAGSPTNTTSLANDLGLSRQTIANYLEVLRRVFLLTRLDAWSTGALAGLTKAPRHHVVDAGLAAALVGADAHRLEDPLDGTTGGLWETFVVSELTKQTTWHDTPPTLHHLRDAGGRHEVDLIVQFRDGRVAAIEVKRTRSPGPRAFDAMRWMRDRLGDRFVQGVVLCRVDDVGSHGDRLSSAPISLLWS